jgi:hypothetical protein
VERFRRAGRAVSRPQARAFRTRRAAEASAARAAPAPAEARAAGTAA